MDYLKKIVSDQAPPHATHTHLHTPLHTSPHLSLSTPLPLHTYTSIRHRPRHTHTHTHTHTHLHTTTSPHLSTPLHTLPLLSALPGPGARPLAPAPPFSHTAARAPQDITTTKHSVGDKDVFTVSTWSGVV